MNDELLKIEKPILEEEIEAKIVGISTIENNIDCAKEYAIKMREYYSQMQFTEETKKEAEEQKAEINKQKKKIEDFRKQIVKKYNEPIQKFETTAKETEKLLKETYDFINIQVKAFDDKELEEIREKIKWYFDEYKQSQEVDFVKFEQLNLNITKGLITSTGNLTKKVQELITDFVDNVKKELELIETLDFKEEILVEYKKDLQCANAIANVQDRHRQLEELERQKKIPVTDSEVQEKISYVNTPKTEEKKYQMTFTVVGTKEQLKNLKEYLLKEGLLNE